MTCSQRGYRTGLYVGVETEKKMVDMNINCPDWRREGCWFTSNERA